VLQGRRDGGQGLAVGRANAPASPSHLQAARKKEVNLRRHIMKITIESTTRLVDIETAGGRVPGRVWEGTTETGIPVYCVITRVAVREDAPQAQFQAELKECKEPSRTAIEAIPLRMII